MSSPPLYGVGVGWHGVVVPHQHPCCNAAKRSGRFERLDHRFDGPEAPFFLCDHTYDREKDNGWDQHDGPEKLKYAQLRLHQRPHDMGVDRDRLRTGGIPNPTVIGIRSGQTHSTLCCNHGCYILRENWPKNKTLLRGRGVNIYF